MFVVTAVTTNMVVIVIGLIYYCHNQLVTTICLLFAHTDTTNYNRKIVQIFSWCVGYKYIMDFKICAQIETDIL